MKTIGQVLADTGLLDARTPQEYAERLRAAEQRATHQLSIFDPPADLVTVAHEHILPTSRAHAQAREAQTHELKRVRVRIEDVILAFCRQRSTPFRMDDLRAWVIRSGVAIAPDSAGRIFRHLKQQGQIDYDVVNRRQSLYRITGVHEGKDQAA